MLRHGVHGIGPVLQANTGLFDLRCRSHSERLYPSEVLISDPTHCAQGEQKST